MIDCGADINFKRSNTFRNAYICAMRRRIQNPFLPQALMDRIKSEAKETVLEENLGLNSYRSSNLHQLF